MNKKYQTKKKGIKNSLCNSMTNLIFIQIYNCTLFSLFSWLQRNYQHSVTIIFHYEHRVFLTRSRAWPFQIRKLYSFQSI